MTDASKSSSPAPAGVWTGNSGELPPDGWVNPPSVPLHGDESGASTVIEGEDNPPSVPLHGDESGASSSPEDEDNPPAVPLHGDQGAGAK